MIHAHPTPYDDINELLELLVSGMRNVLSENLVGIYLYGSLVTGDFDRESSDIDLLAATSSDIDEREFNALLAMHDDFADKHKQWDGRIEVAYLSTTGLKTFRSRRNMIAVISPGESFHIKDAGSDWLINWYTVREKGIALYGPSAETLIEPISKEEYIHSVREYMGLWEERMQQPHSRPSQAYAILTMCRAVYAIKYGEQVSKKQAALWAQQELPEWSTLIQNALKWRADWRNENVDHDATFAETQRFVYFVTHP
jgi:predicted nucleotidyltransferase